MSREKVTLHHIYFYMCKPTGLLKINNLFIFCILVLRDMCIRPYLSPLTVM